MKQDKRPAGAAVKKRRFFNRISRKLMLFVVLMSMVLLALVWLLSVKLLEPMYNRRVLADLNHAADVYSAIIEKYGKFESFDKSGGVHIPSDMMEEILPSVYVDGAHNVSAIDAFVKSVPETAEGNIFLFSAVKDKEYEEMIAHLCDSVPAEFYVVTLIDGERATDAELLGKLFEKYTDRPVVVIESVQKALEYVLEHQEKRTVYCLGSLYLTGMVKETIERMRKEKADESRRRKN